MGLIMYYFAYGSNMSTRIMRDWAAGFEVIGAARLHDYRLAFTRPSERWGGAAADVVVATGQVVWGVLYDIDQNTLEQLNKKEGLGVAYRHLDCKVACVDDQAYAALTYSIISKADSELFPSLAYKTVILEGAVEHHLPAAYIAWLEALVINE